MEPPPLVSGMPPAAAPCPAFARKLVPPAPVDVKEVWAVFTDGHEDALAAASEKATFVAEDMVSTLDKISTTLRTLLETERDDEETCASVRRLLGIARFLRGIGHTGGLLVEELIAGKFMKARDSIHEVRKASGKHPVLRRMVCRLLLCIGTLTRTFKLCFAAQQLSGITPDATTRSIRHTRGGLGTWPRIQTAWMSPSSNSDKPPSPLTNLWSPPAAAAPASLSPTSCRAGSAVVPAAAVPAASTAAAGGVGAKASTPMSCPPRHNRLSKAYVPPPVDTHLAYPSPYPSLSPSTTAGTSASTPLSCLSARMYATFVRRRESLKEPATDAVLCRICEVAVPSKSIQQHSEVCVSRLTALMVIDHVCSAMLKTAHRYRGLQTPLGDSKCALVMQALELCEAMTKESTTHKLAATLGQVQHTRGELGQGEEYGKDEPLAQLLDAAVEACTTVLQRHNTAKDTMANGEMVDTMRLRGTLNVGLSDFNVKGVIARGAFGRVFLVEKRSTKDTYALKVVSQKDMLQRNMAQKLLNERNIMAFTDSNLVVKLHYSFVSTKYLYFAMEHHAGGDLFSMLERLDTLSEPLACFYAAEVYLALEHLHRMSIVHRDVKPDNILLSDTGHIMLTDFGLSDVGAGFVVDSVVAMADTACLETPRTKRRAWDGGRLGGTPDYVAPEIILAEESDRTADLWSLGVLLYEFLTGAPAFAADTNQEVLDNILRGEYEEPEDVSPEAASLIKSLLQYPPESRLTDLRSHGFFAPIEWDTLLTSEAPYKPDLSRDNYKERSAVYPVNETDMEFLSEELADEAGRSKRGSTASPLSTHSPGCKEFLRRRESVCASRNLALTL